MLTRGSLLPLLTCLILSSLCEGYALCPRLFYASSVRAKRITKDIFVQFTAPKSFDTNQLDVRIRHDVCNLFEVAIKNSQDRPFERGAILNLTFTFPCFGEDFHIMVYPYQVNQSCHLDERLTSACTGTLPSHCPLFKADFHIPSPSHQLPPCCPPMITNEILLTPPAANPTYGAPSVAPLRQSKPRRPLTLLLCLVAGVPLLVLGILCCFVKFKQIEWKEKQQELPNVLDFNRAYDMNRNPALWEDDDDETSEDINEFVEIDEIGRMDKIAGT